MTGVQTCALPIYIRYGDECSIVATREIYRALAIGAHRSSLIMAQERGAFPAFDYEKEKDHPYLCKVMSACNGDSYEMWKTTGRRNIALTTTAPVG